MERRLDYSVGQFFEDARQATKDVLENGHVPIIAGGTGLYLRWYVYGKPVVPQASPEIVSEAFSEIIELQKRGDWDAAVQLLVKAGDLNAKDVPLNNWYRLKRSLEIIKSSGSPPSAFHVPYDSFKDQSESRMCEVSQNVDLHGGDRHKDNISENLDYDFMCFFLSSQRLDLYRQIDFRCEDMLSGSDGILSEATQLLDLGLLPNSNSATKAIGYRHAMEFLLRCQENGGGSARDFLSFLTNFQTASRSNVTSTSAWLAVTPEILTTDPPLSFVLGKWTPFTPNLFDLQQAIESVDVRFYRAKFPEVLPELQSTPSSYQGNFAKRQMTWFRNEQIYQWLNASQPLEKVVDFISEAYHDQSGNLVVVPESLQIKKDLSDRRVVSELKSYRAKNRLFISREDCNGILNSIKAQKKFDCAIH
ncbi:hypothetical protein GIB67_000199 [Kingdonia uniflora]|uniref:Uncharacterized protein n=1 Tax=Kingdonia uniflora TaxID=39325 RepID=A0A7J7P9F7_9MAGN|nr:hypothetical protein GIB67_000199 [Kingdonia uniflora]